MALKIVTYSATDPEHVPPNARGMARAWLDGDLSPAVQHAPTAEEAGAKLKAFFEGELAKAANAKPRGRPKKKMEAAVGHEPVADEGEIL